jgi:tRNA1Val (adenine37-N6)-methyltransferase
MHGDSEITRDTLLRGRVTLLQPKHGLRSSLDPVLLAGFLAPPFGRFLDIGCASGALSFLLLARDPSARGVGVEIQPRLAELADQGRQANGVADRFVVLAGDARIEAVVAADGFDLVVINPPFRRVGAGVLPPLPERALAYHEVTLALAEWLDVAARVLQNGGKLGTIFPFDRWPELRDGCVQRGLQVARFRPVLARAGEVPGRVLVEARRGPTDTLTEPPLLVHEQSGYSAEVRRLLGEDA